MDKAERLTKDQQSKRYKKKEDLIFPLEWLHPKEGRHIESIECLLHHDDLIKGTNISSMSDKRKPIEGSLFEKNITQWEGTITAVRSDWQGTITFKGRLPVRFVPISAQPSMPSLGDTVKFCLSFDDFGLSAWRVMRDARTQPSDLSDIVSRDDDSSSEYSEQEDVQKEDLLVAPSLYSIDIQEPDEKHGLDEQKEPQSAAVSKKRTKTHWDEYNEKRMQGVVSFTNPDTGFGFIENADVEDKLFFHASQLREPVTNLEGNIYKDMLLDFKVEKLTERTRAADIRVLNVRKLYFVQNV
jgi:cold shock CspA family protein